MRLQKVSRTASTVSPTIAPAKADARVEPVSRTEPARKRQQPMLRRRLPDSAPEEPMERGSYLDLIV